MHRYVSLAARQTVRTYATRYPRPKPGTAERPPYRPTDPLTNNPNATVTSLPEDGLTFIHRPPPTAPSPNSLTTNPVSPLLRPSTQPVEGPLPPFLRPSANQQPEERMSDEDIEEMRRLRHEDPEKWTRGVLAEKFGCSQNFVGLKAALKKPLRNKILKTRDGEHSRRMEKWSDRHQEVMAIRKKRKEFW